ncbi:MAG TPA: metalloregulator ArsR/SmtB family transcription factor [Candidatus Saccharimonadales bacterium]|nr:metalloregulator ArsR/SmtB family transcription factor [Candidatus Saccharimonadales bacterium]
MPTAATSMQIAHMMKAMSIEARVRLLFHLRQVKEVRAYELQAVLNLTQSTISHHLRVLRTEGLIEEEKKTRIIRLSPGVSNLLSAVEQAATQLYVK